MAEMKTVRELLTNKYPPTEFALLEEVRNGAGFEASNSADFLAVSYWPSRGLEMTGFEMKASRSDWTRELKNAKKAEAFFQYCNYFYLLTTNEKVAYMEEIPSTWGWYHVNEKNKLVCLKQAPANPNPVPWDRSFVVAMLKRAADSTGFVPIDSIEDKLKAAKESGMEVSKYKIKRLEDELTSLRGQIKEFEEISGIRMPIVSYGYDSMLRNTAEAIKFVIKHGTDEKIRRELLRVYESAKSVCAKIDEGLKAFEQRPVTGPDPFDGSGELDTPEEALKKITNQ